MGRRVIVLVLERNQCLHDRVSAGRRTGLQVQVVAELVRELTECWLQEDAEMEVVAVSILSAEAKVKPEELVLEECELECKCLGIHNGSWGARTTQW